MKRFILLFIAFISQFNFAQSVFPSTGENVGIGTIRPQSKLQIGEFNDVGIFKLSIPGLYNFEEVRLGQYGNGASGLEMITHTGLANSFGVRLFVSTDTGMNGLQFQTAYPSGSLDGLAYTTRLAINLNGDVGIGTTQPSNAQSWGKVLDVAGPHHSKILATSENALYKVGVFSHNEEWYGGGGFVGTESNHSLHLITNYNVKMSLLTNGNVGIGELNPKNKLDVKGVIHSQEVKVDMEGWSDFVFKKEYSLPTLEEVEKYIVEKGHLENIPSEEEVLKDGINLGEMNAKLLQKIEELTLYTIKQEKKNNKQSLQIELLMKENEAFKNIFERLSKIEEKLK